MKYRYQDKGDALIVEGGILDKEMWKRYEHGKEFISYAELCKALKRRDHVPLVIDTSHDHTRPLMDARAIIGAVRLTPCPKKRGVQGVYTFYKQDTPQWVLNAIRRGQPVPLSPFKFINVRDHQQEDILFDHVAVLQQTTARCAPEEGCGVGVYDSMSEKEKKKLEETEAKDAKEPLSEPLPSKEPEKAKADEPLVESTEPSEVSEPDALQEVEALKETLAATEKQLAQKEKELASEREPLIGFLLQRGISKEAAEAMSLNDLRTTASALREKQTQGLPGTVPAPAVEPKTYEERKAEAEQKFHKDLTEKSKKEFENW